MLTLPHKMIDNAQQPQEQEGAAFEHVASASSETPPYEDLDDGRPTLAEHKMTIPYENLDDDRPTLPEHKIPIDIPEPTYPSSSRLSVRSIPDFTLKQPKWWSIFRHVWTKQLSVVMVVTGIVVVLYGLMYMGSTWDPQSKLPNASVLIVNNDSGYTTLSSLPAESRDLVSKIVNPGVSMGSVFASTLLNNPVFRNRLKWENVAGVTHEQAIDWVDNGDPYWGILFIPSNFSDNFISNLRFNGSSNAEIHQMSIEYIWDQGRSFTISNFINQAVTSVVSGISTIVATSIANTTSSTPTLVNPSFFISPITLASGRRHPVYQMGANLATYLSLLLMWLGSMMSVTVIQKLLIEKIPHLTGVHSTHGLPPARFPPLQISTAAVALGTCFSFFHALLAWAVIYGLGGRNVFACHPGTVFGFLWFFSLVSLGVISLLSVIFGVDGFAIPASLLLILQITSSGAIVDHIAMAGAMRLGYALPFFWGLKAMKAYLLGSQVHELTKCYLVLSAWGLISLTATIFLATTKMERWRKSRLVHDAVDSLAVLGGTMRTM